MTKQQVEHFAVPESRRAFLAKTAAMAGAAAVMGGAAARREPMPKAGRRAPLGDGEPIRIGVVGPGGMGTEHCRRLADFNRTGQEAVKIVALCDVCDLRAESAAAELKDNWGMSVENIYRKHEELLARDDIHGVLIATTEHWHAKIADKSIAPGTVLPGLIHGGPGRAGGSEDRRAVIQAAVITPARAV